MNLGLMHQNLPLWDTPRNNVGIQYRKIGISLSGIQQGIVIPCCGIPHSEYFSLFWDTTQKIIPVWDTLQNM